MSNSEKLSPGVMLKIGGVEREVKFTLGALRRLEKETGKNALNGEIWKKPGASEIVALVWAALNDRELTIDDVGDLLDMSDMPTITIALNEAFKRANGSGDEKKSEAEN